MKRFEVAAATRKEIAKAAKHQAKTNAAWLAAAKANEASGGAWAVTLKIFIAAGHSRKTVGFCISASASDMGRYLKGERTPHNRNAHMEKLYSLLPTNAAEIKKRCLQNLEEIWL